MNKIKQNKINFSLILIIIIITFSSLTLLSLPVLFNYESKVLKLKKNFYKNFHIYLDTSGKISYKPFPKPHLLVENASLKLKKNEKSKDLIVTKNLKIFISLRDIYLTSFENIISAEISNTNLELKLSEIKSIRNHLYKKVNNPIILKNSKIFIKNEKDEVILISPVRKITYKINDEIKNKIFFIDGKLFGLDFKSNWTRSYKKPLISSHNIRLLNPKIEINNIFKYEEKNKFNIKSYINYARDKLEYNIDFNNYKIEVNSPYKKNINFNVDGNIDLKPFYFDISFNIKNKKIDKIIDKFLLNLILYNKNYIGNLNGIFKVKFNDLNNKLINQGEIDFVINEKKILMKNASFNVKNIGVLNSKLKFIKSKDEVKFKSNNKLEISNHIEFAKVFQVASKKAKKIDQINFDLEKSINDTEFIISNVKINNLHNTEKSNLNFPIKNIQNLRASIRKIID